MLDVSSSTWRVGFIARPSAICVVGKTMSNNQTALPTAKCVGLLLEATAARVKGSRLSEDEGCLCWVDRAVCLFFFFWSCIAVYICEHTAFIGLTLYYTPASRAADVGRYTIFAFYDVISLSIGKRVQNLYCVSPAKHLCLSRKHKLFSQAKV